MFKGLEVGVVLHTTGFTRRPGWGALAIQHRMRKRGQAECHQLDPKSRASTDICVQVLDLGIGSQRFRMREKGVKQGRKKTQYKDVLLSDSLLWGKGALPRVLQSCQHRGWKRKACITGFHSP